MAEIVAFNSLAAAPRRAADKSGKPLGEIVFFTGVRYERVLAAASALKPKRVAASSKSPLKSKS